MRIKDLLESKAHDFSEYVDAEQGLTYDLAEDLVYFMNHDDDTYRRHVYPSITKCLDLLDSKKETSPGLFKTAALESYKNYCQQYPIRELPSSLDEKTLKEVCKLVHEEVCTHKSDGKYKD